MDANNYNNIYYLDYEPKLLANTAKRLIVRYRCLFTGTNYTCRMNETNNKICVYCL